MHMLNAPHISRVRIINFRNFKDVDVELSHKQIIIGENNVGKSNFIRAIQLILDPRLSDEDRFLVESDFHDSLNTPMELGEEVVISIDIKGFDHSKNLLAILSDATVLDDPSTIRLTYQYFATENNDGTFTYQYRVYQGEKLDVPFNHYHRKYLNIKVIPAIRDVETEMKNIRRSPINQLLKNYDISKDELNNIAKRLKTTSDEVLSIDELVHLTQNINSRFSSIIGQQVDSSVSLETIDLDPNRILNTLKIMIGKGQRTVSDTSLGINNILYISLILLSLEDKTVPPILKEDVYIKLLEEDGSEIVRNCYSKKSSSNYILKENIDTKDFKALYDFMDNRLGNNHGFTILAIEEPEAHLHPALQRIIFKDVMKQNTSVLMTTHSPHITSVAPINSIVHLRALRNGTTVKTTASLRLDGRDCKDLERYIDVKKGEIYFGKGIILVEGVTEEYLVPSFAEIFHMPLDRKGIICCNINSTNFKPYVQLLDALGIPYVVITDGDYFYRESAESDRIFGHVFSKEHKHFGYDGLDRIRKILLELNKIDKTRIPTDIDEEDELYKTQNFFIGVYTMEIDMMDISARKKATSIFTKIFNELTFGGDKQKKNFKISLENGNYVDCLKKVESSHSQVGKGRFAQGLSTECTKDNIPSYIKDAIETIFFKVDEL